MRLMSIASGSKGNCTLLSVEGNNYIIDVGISYKCCMDRLASNGIYINKIDGIFITHEHSDHIAGLLSFLRNTSAYVYMTKGTYQGLKVDVEKYASFGRIKIIKPFVKYNERKMSITTFLTSHDAKEPLGYVFEYGTKKIGYISDTGYVHSKYHQMLKNLNVYFIEFNHCVDKLMNSNRPWFLKQRILGDQGHLSNQQATMFLNEVIGENTRTIVMGHLSDECNTVKEAVESFKEIIKNDDISLVMALQNELSKIVVVE